MKATNSNEDKHSDPLLPRHPFFMLCLGPRYTGKSNTSLDMVVNKFGPGYWDLIIIYCKTIDDDDKWDHLRKYCDERCIRTHYTNEQMQEDYEAICRLKDHNPNFRTLIFLDDMISDNISSKNRIDPLARFAAMGRHKNCDIIITTQHYKAMAPAIRGNATNLLVFNIHNGEEQRKLCEENRGLLTKKEFMALLHSIWGGRDFRNSESRPFLHINNQRDIALRFTRNWDEQIIIREVGSKRKVTLDDPDIPGSEDEELDVSEGEFSPSKHRDKKMKN